MFCKRKWRIGRWIFSGMFIWTQDVQVVLNIVLFKPWIVKILRNLGDKTLIWTREEERMLSKASRLNTYKAMISLSIIKLIINALH